MSWLLIVLFAVFVYFSPSLVAKITGKARTSQEETPPEPVHKGENLTPLQQPKIFENTATPSFEQQPSVSEDVVTPNVVEPQPKVSEESTTSIVVEPQPKISGDAATPRTVESQPKVSEGTIILKVDAFSNAESAEHLINDLAKEGFKAYTVNLGKRVAVEIAGYSSIEDAQRARSKLERLGLHPEIAVIKSVASTPATAPEPIAPPATTYAPAQIDEQYDVRAAAECSKGFAGILCREAIRLELCKEKWEDNPPVGQSRCKNAHSINSGRS